MKKTMACALYLAVVASSMFVKLNASEPRSEQKIDVEDIQYVNFPFFGHGFVGDIYFYDGREGKEKNLIFHTSMTGFQDERLIKIPKIRLKVNIVESPRKGFNARSIDYYLEEQEISFINAMNVTSDRNEIVSQIQYRDSRPLRLIEKKEPQKIRTQLIHIIDYGYEGNIKFFDGRKGADANLVGQQNFGKKFMVEVDIEIPIIPVIVSIDLVDLKDQKSQKTIYYLDEHELSNIDGMSLSSGYVLLRYRDGRSLREIELKSDI